MLYGFQSTFPRGERHDIGVGQHFWSVISIHVPAWGTTDYSGISTQQASYFNPRSRVGNDQIGGSARATWLQFQSTFPRGERPLRFLLWLYYIDFNPRSRVGNDDGVSYFSLLPFWFQSTFPRGERQQILTIFHLYIRISNPNLHFNITPFHIFYLIHFFWACFFQLFMVRIFWGFSVYFWFALYRNNTWSTEIPRSIPICSIFVW